MYDENIGQAYYTEHVGASSFWIADYEEPVSVIREAGSTTDSTSGGSLVPPHAVLRRRRLAE